MREMSTMADNPFAPPRVDIAGNVQDLIKQYRIGQEYRKRQQLEATRKSALQQLMSGQEQDPAKLVMGYIQQTGDPEGGMMLAQIARSVRPPQLTPGEILSHEDRLQSQAIERQKLQAQYPWLSQPGAVTNGGTSGTERPRPMSAADMAADKKFAAGDYLTWKQGGFSQTEQNAKSLLHVKDALEKRGGGPGMINSMVGAAVKKSLSGQEDASTILARQYDPELFNLAQGHQSAIVSAMRSLLGARAAQQLFQSVIQTTMDPMAGDKENARRIGLVYDNIMKAGKAKQAMSDYFDKFGTLNGYTGEKFDPDTFDPLAGIDTTPKAAGGGETGGPPPAPPPEAVQKLRDAIKAHPDQSNEIKQAFERAFLKGGRGGADQYLTEGVKPNAWGLQ